MSNPFKDCTQVTPACPVSATIYGYTPNFTGNIILLVVFALAAIAQLAMAMLYRLPSFGSVVTIGCTMEAIGYVGRMLMNNNPWSRAAFNIQIVCLIIAPSFLAAGIYLSLKHIIMALGPDLSRLQPKNYTRIFITCDILSILIQALGGGLAAAGEGSTTQTGSNLIIAGIAIQVVTMGICLLLALDFGYALLKFNKKNPSPANSTDGLNMEKARTYSRTPAFYFYLICSSLAFLFIFVRCIYRLPEMAGGWGNHLMQDETAFLILDGAMIALATILLTVAHPGIFFPDMRVRKNQNPPKYNSVRNSSGQYA